MIYTNFMTVNKSAVRESLSDTFPELGFVAGITKHEGRDAVQIDVFKPLPDGLTELEVSDVALAAGASKVRFIDIAQEH